MEGSVLYMLRMLEPCWWCTIIYQRIPKSCGLSHCYSFFVLAFFVLLSTSYCSLTVTSYTCKAVVTCDLCHFPVICHLTTFHFHIWRLRTTPSSYPNPLPLRFCKFGSDLCDLTFSGTWCSIIIRQWHH